jgi:hypothetical protein
MKYIIILSLLFLFTIQGCLSSGKSSTEEFSVTSDVYWSHVFWGGKPLICREQPELPECRVEPIVRYPNRVLKGFIDIAPEEDIPNNQSINKITLHSFSYKVSGDNCVIESKKTTPEFMEFIDRTTQNLEMTINFKSECHASSLVVTAKKKIEYSSGKTDDSSNQIFQFDIAESDGSPSSYEFDDANTYEIVDDSIVDSSIHKCKPSTSYTCEEKFEKIDDLALSISYVDTSILNGKFTDRFIIKVNDKGFDNSKIGFGIVNGPKKVNSSIDPKMGVMYAYDNYNSGSEVGIIYKGQDKAYFQNSVNGGPGKFPFYIDGGNSQNVRAGDTVVILPNHDSTRIDSHYLGGWTVDSQGQNVDEAFRKYTVPLKWNFTPSANEPASRIDNLAFVIGTNSRVNECNHDTSTVLIKAFNGDNELTNGAIYVNIEYEPYMVGNDIFIYANYRIQKQESGKEYPTKKHSGDAIRYTLRGKGINEQVITLTNPDTVDKIVNFDFRIRLEDSFYQNKNENTGTLEDVDELAQGVKIDQVYNFTGLVEPTFSRSTCKGISTVSLFLKAGESSTFTVKNKNFDHEYIFNGNAP